MARGSDEVTDRSAQAARAERLRALYRGPGLLMLPNAWDAATARAVAEAGFPAVATTSVGVSDSLGWADGERTPPDEVFAATARVAPVVGVPVTADLEAGYSLAPADLVARLIATGAVGCNLEDTDHARGMLVEPQRHAERIAAVKAAGRAAGVDLVVNARIDVFVRRIGAPEERVALALERARLYAEAGADCVYPILLDDDLSIAEFVHGSPAPVNITVRPSAPPLARLRELGVARVSYAGQLYRWAMAEVRSRLDAIRTELPAEVS
jgi:2-methylisocitrate lyase-like PEP mutase family enzyme